MDRRVGWTLGSVAVAAVVIGGAFALGRATSDRGTAPTAASTSAPPATTEPSDGERGAGEGDDGTSASTATTTPRLDRPVIDAAPSPPSREEVLRASPRVDPDRYRSMDWNGGSMMVEVPRTVAFRLPNLGATCVIDDRPAVTCDLGPRTGGAPAEPGRGCGETSWAPGYVRLGTDELVDGMCTGGIEVPSAAEALPVGSAVFAHDHGCLSEEQEVTCVHVPSGRAFTASSGRVERFLVEGPPLLQRCEPGFVLERVADFIVVTDPTRVPCSEAEPVFRTYLDERDPSGRTGDGWQCTFDYEPKAISMGRCERSGTTIALEAVRP